MTGSPYGDDPLADRREATGEGRSRVWIRLRGDTDHTQRYVRGDRVVEVQRIAIPPTAEVAGNPGAYLVKVVILDSLDGGYGSRHLWDLPDEVTATNAALALMQILNSGQPGLVVLSEDTHRPELLPLDLNLNGLT